MRSILSTFTLLFLATVAPAADGEKKPTVVPDVIYGRKDGMTLTFDVIKPAKPNGAGILLLQSGGWYSRWSDPQNWLRAGKPFLDKGITLFIVRHGELAEVHRPRSHRGRAASRSLHSHEGEGLRRRPERLGVTGSSAEDTCR